MSQGTIVIYGPGKQLFSHTPQHTAIRRDRVRERYEQPQPAVNMNMKNQKQVLNFFTAPEIFIVDMERR